MTNLEKQFHRAQARLRTREGVAVSLGQKAVAPVFSEGSAGEAGYYDIPTYLRNRLVCESFDNQVRLAGYIGRVRKHIQEMAA